MTLLVSSPNKIIVTPGERRGGTIKATDASGAERTFRPEDRARIIEAAAFLGLMRMAQESDLWTKPQDFFKCGPWNKGASPGPRFAQSIVQSMSRYETKWMDFCDKNGLNYRPLFESRNQRSVLSREYRLPCYVEVAASPTQLERFLAMPFDEVPQVTPEVIVDHCSDEALLGTFKVWLEIYPSHLRGAAGNSLSTLQEALAVGYGLPSDIALQDVLRLLVLRSLAIAGEYSKGEQLAERTLAAAVSRPTADKMLQQRIWLYLRVCRRQLRKSDPELLDQYLFADPVCTAMMEIQSCSNLLLSLESHIDAGEFQNAQDLIGQAGQAASRYVYLGMRDENIERALFGAFMMSLIHIQRARIECIYPSSEFKGRLAYAIAWQDLWHQGAKEFGIDRTIHVLSQDARLQVMSALCEIERDIKTNASVLKRRLESAANEIASALERATFPPSRFGREVAQRVWQQVIQTAVELKVSANSNSALSTARYKAIFQDFPRNQASLIPRRKADVAHRLR